MNNKEIWSKIIISNILKILKNQFDPDFVVPNQVEETLFKTVKSTLTLMHQFGSLFEIDHSQE